MAGELKRAAENAMVEIRRQAQKGACGGCDPGGEGSEVWGEIEREMTEALKVDRAQKFSIDDFNAACKKAGVGGLARATIRMHLE